MVRAAAAMFGDLVGELNSPLRALSVSPGMFHILLQHMCFTFSVSLLLIFIFFPCGAAVVSTNPRSGDLVDMHQGD
jgi:hypothetical protein